MAQFAEVMTKYHKGLSEICKSNKGILSRKYQFVMTKLRKLIFQSDVLKTKLGVSNEDNLSLSSVDPSPQKEGGKVDQMSTIMEAQDE